MTDKASEPQELDLGSYTALSAPQGSLEDCVISQALLACCLPKGFVIKKCKINGSRGSWICGQKYRQSDLNRWLGCGIEDCTFDSSRIRPEDPLSGCRYTKVSGIDSAQSNFQATVSRPASEGSDKAFARALLEHKPKPRGTDMATFDGVRQLIVRQYDPSPPPINYAFTEDSEVNPSTRKDSASNLATLQTSQTPQATVVAVRTLPVKPVAAYLQEVDDSDT